MNLKPLLQSEFDKTFVKPMTLLDGGSVPFYLQPYLKLVVRNVVSDPHFVHSYASADHRHTHHVFASGTSQQILVVVCDQVAENIRGHRILEFPDGSDETGIAALFPQPTGGGCLTAENAKDLPNNGLHGKR